MFSLNRDKEQKTDRHSSINSLLDEKNTQNEINSNENIMNNQENIESNKEGNWNEDFSWSRILMSDSESLRQTGSVYRQKDTNMVSLVRRLELFPSNELILSTRKLFEDEIHRLNKVREVVEFESNQLKDSNPILTQAAMEVESELSKISIEKESFEKKLTSEVRIIDDLVQTIISHESKNPALIAALLKIYNFDLDKGNKVIHKSNEAYFEKPQSSFSSLKPSETLAKPVNGNKSNK